MEKRLQFYSKGKLQDIYLPTMRRVKAKKRGTYLLLPSGELLECPFSISYIWQIVQHFGFVKAQKSYLLNPKAVTNVFHKHHHYALLDDGRSIYITAQAYTILKIYLEKRENPKPILPPKNGFSPLFFN